MKYTFECAEHEEYGGLGWRLESMPAFDPLRGMAVAHDVLEHWPNDDSTTGELMALGAMIYVRNDNYFANRGKVYPRPSHHFNGELGDLLLKIQYGEWIPLKDYPKQYATCRDEFAREEISEGIKLCKKYIADEREDELIMTPSQWRNVANWLKHGFNKAQRRYKDIDKWELLDVFNRIETKADESLKYAEAGVTKLVVKLNWKRDGLLSDRRRGLLQLESVFGASRTQSD